MHTSDSAMPNEYGVSLWLIYSNRSDEVQVILAEANIELWHDPHR